MKNIIFKAVLGFSILTATTALNSCNKENVNDDLVTSYNQAQADETFNDVDNISDEAADVGSVSYKTEEDNSLLAGGAVITRDTVSMPHVMTIDFGTGAGCTGHDGKTRTGKIIVTYDGPYRAIGTTITITFDNFFVNGNQVTGSKTIYNNGPNTDGYLSFTINVTGQITLANGGGTISWTSQRNRLWIAGSGTPTRDDDQFSITGTATGTAANGNEFTATTITPLLRKLELGCRRHFVSGSVLIQKTGKPDRTIDFGNGACDDVATVTINGVSHTIQLRQ